MNKRQSANARITEFRTEVEICVNQSAEVVERLVVQGVYMPPVICDHQTQRQLVGADRKYRCAIDLQLDQQRGAGIVGIAWEQPLEGTIEYETNESTATRYRSATIVVAGSIPQDTALPMIAQLNPHRPI